MAIPQKTKVRKIFDVQYSLFDNTLTTGATLDIYLYIQNWIISIIFFGNEKIFIFLDFTKHMKHFISKRKCYFIFSLDLVLVA